MHTSQQSTVLHSTAQHCTILNSTSLYCMTQHDTAQQDTTLHNTAQYFTTLHNTSQHFTTLHNIIAQYCTKLHRTDPCGLESTEQTNHSTMEKSINPVVITKQSCAFSLIQTKIWAQSANNPVSCLWIDTQHAYVWMLWNFHFLTVRPHFGVNFLAAKTFRS